MTFITFLQEFVIILAAGVVVIYISHRVAVPAVVGFLLTGLLIGPTGLALVPDQSQVELFAEIGVVILLFTIGLEFSLERVKQIKRPFIVGGSLQALLTTATVAFISVAIGLSVSEAIFWGFLVTMSSTAIVLRLYSQRHELESPQGKIAIGILLFQDVLIVLMIFLTPVLGGTVAISVQDILLRFVGGCVLIAVVFFLARYLMPKVLHAIVRTQIREIFVLGSLAIALGLALLTAAFEFSLALGAFLAGLIFSESEYSYQVVAEVAPFRDVFSSMFFIAIGMLLDLEFVSHNLLNVLGMGLIIFLIKTIVVLAVVLWMKFPWRISAITAIALAQIGEFSFVLAKVGQTHGLVNEVLFQIFLASSILTMLATPLLINAAPRIAEQSQRVVLRKTYAAEAIETAGNSRLNNHVIIVGYGLNGANLARVLKETAIPYVIIELNGETVRKAKQEGQPILYGDATRRDILELCRINTANMIVLAISDPVATRQAVKLAKTLNPSIFTIVRTRNVSEVDVLKRLGADEAIPEEFETSIEIFTRVLQRYHVPRNLISGQIRLLRGENYQMLRSPSVKHAMSDKLVQWLAAGTTDIFLVDETSPAALKTLQELDLSRHTGAKIIAVVRGEASYTNPASDFRILAGDALVIVGNHAEIEKAFQWLEGKIR